MDIVERLRDDESMYDADDVDLHLDAADEIERLREELRVSRQSTTILIKSLDEEIEQLRQQNAELVEALRRVIAVADRDTVDFRFAKVAIAKATRGE